MGITGPPTRRIRPFFLKLELSRSATRSSGENGSHVRRSLTSSTPISRPSPRTSPMQGWSPIMPSSCSLKYAPTSAEFWTSPSVSMISMFLSDAAADTGWPLEVSTWRR